MNENYAKQEVIKFLMWKLEGGKKEFDKNMDYKFFCIDGIEIDVYVKNVITNEEMRITMSFPEIVKKGFNMTKCKHPKKEIFGRWVTSNGNKINFLAGVDKIKREYTCLACGKVLKTQ